MSELREAAQAIVDELEDWISNGLIADLRAALAQPESGAEPVAWQRRYITPTGPSGWQDCAPEDVEHYRSRVGQVEVRPLYAHPPRDEWRPASDPPEDDRAVIVWYTPDYPASGAPGGLSSGYFRDGEWWPYSGSETITHWRDVQPPTEGA